MAAALMPLTSFTFPEAVSFVINLAIPKFSSCVSRTIVSEKVVVGKHAWFLKVYPDKSSCTDGSSSGSSAGSVGLCLCRDSLDASSSDQHQVSYAASIVDAKTNQKIAGRSAKGTDYVLHRGNPAIMRVLPQFIKHSDIWGPNPTLVLSDDILKIQAEVRVTLMPPDGRKRKDTSDNALEVFRKKSRSMYDSEVGRDFVLVSADGVERRVHKAVLNSSSPVFNRMFESNMTECKTGRCEIKDVSGNTVDLLLRYMYYGSLEIPLAQAKDVLQAADKYEMYDLREHCEDILIGNLSMDNVGEMLLFANKMLAGNLQSAAMGYLAADPKKSLNSPQMVSLLDKSHTYLTLQIMAALCKVPLQVFADH